MENFETVLLEKGENLSQSCPRCSKWICGFPDIKGRIFEGKRATVYLWQCWNCKIEFVQVKDYER